MNIINGIPGYTEEMNGRFEPVVRDLLQRAMSNVGVPPGAVDEIFIADTENYGGSCNSYFESKGVQERVSDDRNYAGVGKYFKFVDEIGLERSAIVFRSFILEVTAARLVNGERPPFAGDAQHMWYVIAHEMGHAKDYALRKVEVEPQSLENHPSDEEVIGTLFHQVETEYAACHFSGSCMSQEVFATEVDRTYGFTAKLLSQLQQIREMIIVGEAKECDLDTQAKFAASDILNFYAKLFAHRCRNKKLKSDLRWISDQVRDIVLPLEPILAQRWIQYPNFEYGNAAIVRAFRSLQTHLNELKHP